MRTSIAEYLHQQRILCDRLARKMNCSFCPVTVKTSFAGYILGNKKTVPIEAKIRNCTYGTYESTLVEKKKMDKLFNAYKRQQQSGCYYVEFFSDNKAVLFDLTTVTFEWCKEDCNAFTTDSNKKTSKQVAFLSYNQGILIDLTRPTEQEFKIGVENFKETLDGKIELKVTALF